MILPFSENIAGKCPSKGCHSCGLFNNQFPAFDCYNDSRVIWVGLSAVKYENEKCKRPLSSYTNSGKLIHDIEKPFLESMNFYKTNIVKCLPLKNGTIRYPSRKEMNNCFPVFEQEINDLKPSIVFLLGKQVADFTLKRFGMKLGTFNPDFRYEAFTVNGIAFIPIHHPSFILVYRRKRLDEYIASVRNIILNEQPLSELCTFDLQKLASLNPQLELAK